MAFLGRLVSVFVVPLPIAVLLLAAGVGLLWFSRRQKTGKGLVTAGLGLLLLFGFDVVPDGLIGSLEEEQQPLYPREKVTELERPPRWIVVLGSGHTHHPSLPPAAQLAGAALARLAEAIRLYREVPGAKLLVSGAPGEPVRHGEMLAAAARGLGVPDGDIVVDVSAWDTREEARAVSARVGAAPFVLVTSASHMSRALRLFRALGMAPIPAPTDYVTLDSGVSLDDFVPTPGALGKSGMAVHELFGNLVSQVLGE